MIKKVTREYESPAVIDYSLLQWEDGCIGTSFDTNNGTELIDQDDDFDLP